jgi:hypothetical protein
MQFKKHIILFLAFSLLLSSSGLAFNVHYCGEKIAAISSVFTSKEVCDDSKNTLSNELAKKPESACCSKKKINHKKCCSNKEVNLKDKYDKFTSKLISFDIDLQYFFTPWMLISFSLGATIQKSQSVGYYCNANAPPLYKIFCQLLFYA